MHCTSDMCSQALQFHLWLWPTSECREWDFVLAWILLKIELLLLFSSTSATPGLAFDNCVHLQFMSWAGGFTFTGHKGYGMWNQNNVLKETGVYSKLKERWVIFVTLCGSSLIFIWSIFISVYDNEPLPPIYFEAGVHLMVTIPVPLTVYHADYQWRCMKLIVKHDKGMGWQLLGNPTTPQGHMAHTDTLSLWSLHPPLLSVSH